MSAAYKVHPEEVEAVINRHPVLPCRWSRPRRIPSPARWCRRCGAEEPSMDGLRTAAARHSAVLPRQLAAHKVPTVINIVPMLAVGESGKLVRRHA
jgi:acyl-coenzyme A synthetase/AMP-(fatty) acid ligase